MDREKVIEALHCRAYDDDFPCSICAYYRPDEKPVAKCDYRGLMDDAIALLKEQEESIPISWLKEKLEGHPELSYAVTDGIINVLDLWEGGD